MDKRLVNSLLRVFHSDATRFPASKALLEFSQSFNVGRAKGASLWFSAKDKREIQAFLLGRLSIDASTTSPDDWTDNGRANALPLGCDEKFARVTVREGRLQIKAMRWHALSVYGGRWMLPDRTDLGVDLTGLLKESVDHDCLLVVENRQTFIELWHVESELLRKVSTLNPLVVYRGDANGGAQVDAVHGLIEKLDLPVFAFVDFDPAGMVIAASLPRLDGLVAPAAKQLGNLLSDYGLSERFIAQIPTNKHVLEQLALHPVIGVFLAAIMASGKALPQEFFH